MSEKEGGSLESLLVQHVEASSHSNSNHTVQHVLMISVAVLFGLFLMMNTQQVPSASFSKVTIQGFMVKENTETATKVTILPTPEITAKPHEPSWMYLLKTNPQLSYIKILFYTWWVFLVGLCSVGFIEHKRKKCKHP